jgi:outer membrane protein OmpA-like peptidoglycan-associated protein
MESKMRKYHKWTLCGTIISAIGLIAMQNTSYDNRYSGQNDSYGRLLSGQYQKIAQLEGNIGTYEHFDFFKQKSKSVQNAYNPRPMQTQGLSNLNIGNSRDDIMPMGRTLERFMTGFEMRYAPNDVAGMHASYECYLKNVNINAKLAKHCKQAFATFENNAIRIADEQIKLNHNNMPVMQNEMTTNHFEGDTQKNNLIQNQPIDNPAVSPQNIPAAVVMPTAAPEINKKPEFMGVPVSDKVSETVPMPKIMPSKDVAKKIETPKIDAVVVPSVTPQNQPATPVIVDNESVTPMSVAIPQETSPEQVTPEKTAPVSPPITPEMVQTQSEEVFNPNDYTHPRLREKLNAPKTQTAPEQIPPASIEGTITKPTDQEFGIKPLSNMKTSIKPTAYYFNKNLMNIGVNNLGTNMGMDYTPTASVPSPIAQKREQFIVSFKQGGTIISPDNQFVLSQIKQKINAGTYQGIKIIGHSDMGGSASVNQAVSFERASNVHTALDNSLQTKVKNIIIDGVGTDSPILSLNPADDRNRRVVVELIK